MSDLTLKQLELPFEIWKPVVGYEGIYIISNSGCIKRIMATAYWSAGHIIKQYPTKDGYRKTMLGKGGGRKHLLIHRLVAFAFLGEPPTPKHQVNHKNGIKDDNRAENLEWVTQSQNNQHAYDHNLVTRKGENAANAKLTVTEIFEIKKLLAAGIRQVEIAELYEVHQTHISRIKRGVSWNYKVNELKKRVPKSLSA